jgi:hypothetical protein
LILPKKKMNAMQKLFTRNNVLRILLFGTLIGLNEAFTGSLSIPYRSVLINSITIALLLFARLKVPHRWSSLIIVAIAVLFKLNNTGFHTCTMNVFLCGPTALLLLGISFEVYAGLFIRKIPTTFWGVILTTGITALTAFLLFGTLNTFVLNVWSVSRFLEYSFVKGLMTVMASIVLTVPGVHLNSYANKHPLTNLNIAYNLIIVFVICSWIFGSFVAV